MPRPRRRVLVPNPKALEDWKHTATHPFPNDSLTLLWIIKGLLYRLKRSNPHEAKYATFVVKKISELEKSSRPGILTKFKNARLEVLSMLIARTPKNLHRLPTLHLQKSILIDRLEQFERSKGNNIARWIQEEEEKILQDLTAFLHLKLIQTGCRLGNVF